MFLPNTEYEISQSKPRQIKCAKTHELARDLSHLIRVLIPRREKTTHTQAKVMGVQILLEKEHSRGSDHKITQMCNHKIRHQFNTFGFKSEAKEMLLRTAPVQARFFIRKSQPKEVTFVAMNRWYCKVKITLGKDQLNRSQGATKRTMPGSATRVPQIRYLLFLIRNSAALAIVSVSYCRNLDQEKLIITMMV